jgi:hypothetical protein
MNAKAALCQAFLQGKIINVKNCPEITGLTNAAREVSRMVEKPFGVVISRQQMEGDNRYGVHCTWVNYRLNRDAKYNQEGIAKMREYVKQHAPHKGTICTPANQSKLF